MENIGSRGEDSPSSREVQPQKEQLVTEIKDLVTWFFEGEKPPQNGDVIKKYPRVSLYAVEKWENRPNVSSDPSAVPSGDPLIVLSWSQRFEEKPRTFLSRLSGKPPKYTVYPTRRSIALRITPATAFGKRIDAVKWVYTLEIVDGTEPQFYAAEESYFPSERLFSYRNQITNGALNDQLTTFRDILRAAKLVADAVRIAG